MTDDYRCVLCGFAAYRLDAMGLCQWCRDGRGWGPGMLTYRSQHRDGTNVWGTLAAGTDLPEWVKRVYRAGWQDLTVEDADGNEVGGIVAHPDTGRRVWWADNNLTRSAAGTGGAR